MAAFHYGNFDALVYVCGSFGMLMVEVRKLHGGGHKIVPSVNCLGQMKLVLDQVIIGEGGAGRERNYV